jgi:Holliday junction resolvase
MTNKTTDKSRAGKAAREKGARFERELSKLFNEHGFHTHRGYVFHKQSDVVDLLGIHVEAKAVERLNPWAALQQAITESDKRKDGMPTVFWKRSRKGIMVCMRFEDWIKLYKIARGKVKDGILQDNINQFLD